MRRCVADCIRSARSPSRWWRAFRWLAVGSGPHRPRPPCHRPPTGQPAEPPVDTDTRALAPPKSPAPTPPPAAPPAPAATPAPVAAPEGVTPLQKDELPNAGYVPGY